MSEKQIGLSNNQDSRPGSTAVRTSTNFLRNSTTSPLNAGKKIDSESLSKLYKETKIFAENEGRAKSGVFRTSSESPFSKNTKEQAKPT